MTGFHAAGRRAWLAGACAVVLCLEAGCATTAKPQTDSAAADRRAAIVAECRAEAERTGGSVPRALGEGALLTGYLVLVGASEGVWWGAVTGGSRGDGAWIAAAVGGGIGTIIGLAADISKGMEARGRFRASYESCLAGRVNP